MSDNLNIWNRLHKPPVSALKAIQAGRLKGKSDINPQWRMQAMTEVFGPCGIGWKYAIDKLWTEPGSDNQMAAFASVSLYYKHEGEWSSAIPGIGGSMFIEQESRGMHTSDESYKMAVTDALSVAMKSLGVAAEVYLGNFDGSKYKQDAKPASQSTGTGNQGQSATGQGTQSQGKTLTEMEVKIKDLLHDIYGDDKKQKGDACERLSFIPASGTYKETRGERDFTKLTEKRQQVLYGKLKKIKEGMAAQPCKECGAILQDGKCWNVDCGNFAG